ncbi:ABC transporter permease [Streptomyces sp. AV19]|uniref:ABC transporter permease n=1 Tax=Streptomyces sp. AV19 TaxID=2793068 RepID=UPI0018FF02BB|nr:ABC transporter permease [Streptomyces sp. AV19]MBH1935627.1 ABC transporter permease [Streptomyces sp. AV19]MDG4534514.1 ABC transporter permease [Streptomyces sp. AV19]
MPDNKTPQVTPSSVAGAGPGASGGPVDTSAASVAAAAELALEAGKQTSTEKARSLGQDAWRELRRSWLFWTSGILLVLLILMAAWPTLFTDVDPRQADLRNHYLGAPQWSHFFQEDWFGYNVQGQSVYARTVHGARASIIVGVCVTLAVTVLGGIVGMIAGYFGGWVDTLLSRITDIFFGIPLLLGGLVLLQAFTNRTIWTVTFALAAFGWMQIARVMRGAVITQKQADFVTAARALGAGTGRILFRHILPNVLGPVIVVATIALGGYIATEATLSYLGIGLKDPTVSWGVDISASQKDLRDGPHALLMPAGFLSLTVLAFILLGDAVRDALDPKLR